MTNGNKKIQKTISILVLMVFLFVTFLSGIAPMAAYAETLTKAPEISESLRTGTVKIVGENAEDTEPLTSLLYNGKVKKCFFAYTSMKNRNQYLTNYPVYCVVPDQLGVNHLGDTDGNIIGTVAHPKIYGAIMAGYPYKTLAELGVNSNREGYYATRNVVWTIAGDWDYSLWTTDGSEEGARVKAAMDKIYNAAMICGSIPVETEVVVASATANDKADEAYFYRTFIISTNQDEKVTNLEVHLVNAPTGAVLLDENDKVITSLVGEKDENGYVSYQNTFKVRVPLAQVTEDMQIDVQVYVQSKNYAVYYLETDGTCQDYYLTTDPTGTVKEPDPGTPEEDPTILTGNYILEFAKTNEPDKGDEEEDVPLSPGVEKPSSPDGTITILKMDKRGNYLPGATFEVLKDGASIGTYVTGANGAVSIPVETMTSIPYYTTDSHDGDMISGFTHMQNGTAYVTYSIREISAPAGYLKDDAVKTVTLYANGNGGVQEDTFEVVFVNEKYGNLVIQKSDKDTKKLLSGAVFKVTYLPGANDTYSFSTTVTTDGTGNAKITGIRPGSYSVQEITAPSNYELDNSVHHITITSDTTTYHYMSNAHKPGLSIYKMDPNMNIPLSGAVFKIEGIDNSYFGEFKTDHTGYIEVENLPQGSYKVTELSAPAGYIISGESVKTIELTPGNLHAQLIFENLQKATLTITKTDKETGEAIKGTTYEVKGIDVSYLQTFTTDSTGKIYLDNMTPGSYVITETAAAPGYVLDSANTETLELLAGEDHALTFQNSKLPTLTITKTAKITKEPIAGVTYRISEKGGAKVDDFITDADGRIFIDRLKTGWYTITEISVPNGVILDDTPRDVWLEEGKATTINFENSIEPVLKIKKLDEITKDPLQNAKFQIWYAENETSEGNLTDLGTFWTDENGLIDMGQVAPGWYRIQEVTAPEGYEFPNPDYKDVFMKADEDKTVTFKDVPKSAIIIKKVDADTGLPLEGAYFRVKYLAGTSGTGGTTIGEYETSVNGTIVLTSLKAGTYLVEEISAPNGYVLHDAVETVFLSGANQDVITVLFGNDKMGSLLITKKDAVTGEPLSNVKFSIRYSDGNVVGNANGVYTTDSTGCIRIDGLKPGVTVTATEIETREGYHLDHTPQSIKIATNETMILEFTNMPKSDLIIVKRDAFTGAPLAGVEFLVTDSNGNYLGTENGKYVTGLDGTIRIDNLDKGLTIKAQEVKTLDGYVPDKTPKTIKIKENETMVLEFLNQSKSGLLITKVDKDSGRPLSDVEFLVTDSLGRVIGPNKGYYTTNQQGQILIEGLMPGMHVIVTETMAKDGYVLDNTSQIAVIQANETAKLEFRNQAKSGLLIYKKDAVDGKPLAGVEFFVTDEDGTVIGPNNGYFTTDSSGTILITDFEPGTVIIAKETRAVHGYVLDSAAKSAKILTDGIVTLEFLNEPKTNLLITKKDALTGAPLAGVQFKVTDSNDAVIGNSDGIFTTDSAGTILVTDLTPGISVIAKEVKTVDGYVLDDTPKTIEIKSGAVNTIEFLNMPKSGLVIVKKDSITGAPLSGVQFEVTDAKGAAIGSSNGIFTTDSAGKIVIGDLAPGTDIIAREIKTVPGYVLDDVPKTITIKAGGVNTLEFTNQPLSDLVIYKKDAVTGAPLAGVEFLVTDSKGSVIGNANGKFVTDSAGTITISNLMPGDTIIVKELNALPGYVLDDASQTITIKENETAVLEFRNEPKGSLVIVKTDAITGEPLKGVEFTIQNADGAYTPDAEGAISSNGKYYTDSNGQIILNNLAPDTYVVTETKTIEGYVMDSMPQTVRVNTNDTQTLYFANNPIGGLTIIKSDEETGKRIEGAKFEIRKNNGEFIGAYTTDEDGLIHIPELENGWYTVTELKAAKGYFNDAAPKQIEVVNGKTATLEITNSKSAQILIHKVDALTGDGVYGAVFILYDRNKNPIGQYQSDQNGYVFIDEGLNDGKYFLREIKAPDGYIEDNALKTVYVRYGATTEIEWENTAIRGQIQIVKKSADDNPMNGLPKGTLLEGAVFEIYDKAGNIVDTIQTDKNGRAASKLLPLSRYTIREVKAPENYAVNDTVMNAYLDYEGQIVTFEVTNESVSTGVDIKKVGYHEVMSGQPIKYTFLNIENRSSVALNSFYWRDIIPGQVQLDSIVTGTYNQQNLSYKIVYKTNLSYDQYRTLADNLSTAKNYVLDARPQTLGLANGERITEIMFVFGTVKAGFATVETPYIYGTVIKGLMNNTAIVNNADAGGVYNGQWIMGNTRWLTTIYSNDSIVLPKTGY